MSAATLKAAMAGAFTAVVLLALYTRFISASLAVAVVFYTCMAMAAWLTVRSQYLTGRSRVARSTLIALGVGVPNALFLGMLTPLAVGFFVYDTARLVNGRHEHRANRVRKSRVSAATEAMPTTWLIDAFGAPESTARADLLDALDVDTAWALVRLNRKGVPAEFVAERWSMGESLAVNTLIAEYREGAAS